jgi:BMFP domain-containing protein YqiC
VDWVRHTYTERVRQLPKEAVSAVDELAHTVETNYRELLGNCFTDLTVEHADTVERQRDVTKLVTAVLRLDPIRSLVAELDSRLAAMAAAEKQRIAAEKQRHAQSPQGRRHTIAGSLHPQSGSGIQKQRRIDSYKQDFLKALRPAVTNHPRYRNAIPADIALFRQRTEEVETLWSRPINYKGNIADDLEIAFKRIFRDR